MKKCNKKKDTILKEGVWVTTDKDQFQENECVEQERVNEKMHKRVSKL